jgi:hypothetical protein
MTGRVTAVAKQRGIKIGNDLVLGTAIAQSMASQKTLVSYRGKRIREPLIRYR